MSDAVSTDEKSLESEIAQMRAELEHWRAVASHRRAAMAVSNTASEHWETRARLVEAQAGKLRLALDAAEGPLRAAVIQATGGPRIEDVSGWIAKADAALTIIENIDVD